MSFGFSPALGFIHSGRATSFVYDVADFYKMELAVPVAFKEAKEGSSDLERRVRVSMREIFRSERLLERVEKDVFSTLDVEIALDLDPVGFLAGDSLEESQGGVNYGDLGFP